MDRIDLAPYLTLAVRAQEILPAGQSPPLPRPVLPERFETNKPGAEAPILVTGNDDKNYFSRLHTISPASYPLTCVIQEDI